ncbi:DUF6275 family protein [Limosilactobacillus fermentum]
MTEFNQDKFESDAKKLVAKYLNYEVNEKEVFIVWFSKVGANAKAMLSEEGKYKVDVYDITDVVWGLEKGIAMKMNDNQHFCSEKSNDTSTSRVQVDVDKVQTPIVDKIQISDETKCHVCQEQHNVWGLTDAFQLHIKDDILFMKDKSVHNDAQFPKDAFKIKYCPFCGRKL